MIFKTLPHHSMSLSARMLVTAGLAAAPMLQAGTLGGASGPSIVVEGAPLILVAEVAPPPVPPDRKVCVQQIMEQGAVARLIRDYEAALGAAYVADEGFPEEPSTHADLSDEYGVFEDLTAAGAAVDPLHPLKLSALYCYVMAKSFARGIAGGHEDAYLRLGGNKATCEAWKAQVLADTATAMHERLTACHRENQKFDRTVTDI